MLAAGQRITRQRDVVAGVLERAKRPLGAREVCAAVAETAPDVGRATVFRTLHALVSAGIVQRVTLAEGQTGYLLCGADGHHHHLVCTTCGRTTDLPEPLVAPFLHAVEEANGFRVDHSNFDVYGRCASCGPSAALACRPVRERDDGSARGRV
jgi:Fur family ferric uptake transcriptional regulator